MRDFAITSAKQGVTRQRNKGGPAKDSFYTLKNCYVTSDRSVVPRPGTRLDTTLPAGTKGLMMFRGKLYVFSAEPVVMTNPKYVNIVLQNPDPESTAGILAIHFAQPFLGYPFVVAEFGDAPGTYIAYWLQEQGTWQPETIYMLSDVVQPTVQTGYTYEATRLNPASPAWSPNKTVQIGDVFEPTVFNGYKYEVIDIQGANPATGDNEPAWIAQDGAIVNEDSDFTPSEVPVTPKPTPPLVVDDRYNNQGGYVRSATDTQQEQ